MVTGVSVSGVSSISLSGIALLTVTSGGAGYTSVPTVTFMGGGGSGAAATAVVDTNNVVTGLLLTNAGTGYTSAPTIVIGGPGTGATATATIATAGSGYSSTNPPAVTITGTGTGATATAVVAGGLVTGIIVTNPGVGYTSVPTVTIAPPAGTGQQAQAAATITTPGSGYTSAPTVTIAAPVNIASGNGYGLVVSAQDQFGNVDTTFNGPVTLEPSGGGLLRGDDKVGLVTIQSGGTGYSSANPPTVTFGAPPAGGTRATGTAVVSAGGAVTGVNIINPGSGYTTPPTITFTSNPGTGASALVTLGVTVNAVNGVAIFSGLSSNTIATNDTIPVAATGSSLPPTSTSTFNVTAAQATQLIIPNGGQPTTATAGTPFTVTVQAQNGLGVQDTTYNGPVTIGLVNNTTGAVLGGVESITPGNRRDGLFGHEPADGHDLGRRRHRRCGDRGGEPDRLRSSGSSSPIRGRATPRRPRCRSRRRRPAVRMPPPARWSPPPP